MKKKVTITYEFETVQQAAEFDHLNRENADVAEATLPPVIESAPKSLEKMTVAELKDHAASIGVQVAPGLRKKADLIACINGTYVAAPVAPVAVPAQPAFDPMTGQPLGQVATPVAIDRDGICNDVKAKYADAQTAGISNDALNNTISTHLQRIGCVGTKVSELEDNQLLDFHSGFVAQVASFIAHANGQVAPAATNGLM